MQLNSLTLLMKGTFIYLRISQKEDDTDSKCFTCEGIKQRDLIKIQN